MMVDNQHKKIKGYRDLTDGEIQLMNNIKSHEADLKRLFETTFPKDLPADSARWLAIAKTHLETGFMYAVKAVARPSGQLGSGE